MKRIYIKNIEGKEITLDKENLNYLIKTLRFKGGENIQIFDGENEYIGIYENKKIKIQNKIREKEDTFLKLAIAEIQKDRLEWIIEKGTELGVNNFFLLKTERTQKEYKIERIKNIIISACKQSKRVSIPEVLQISLNDFLCKIDKTEWCYCSLNSQEKKISTNVNGAIIGPEGGWTENEEVALLKNISPLFLHNNVLRTETAAITALNYIYFSKNYI